MALEVRGEGLVIAGLVGHQAGACVDLRLEHSAQRLAVDVGDVERTLVAVALRLLRDIELTQWRRGSPHLPESRPPRAERTALVACGELEWLCPRICDLERFDRLNKLTVVSPHSFYAVLRRKVRGKHQDKRYWPELPRRGRTFKMKI